VLTWDIGASFSRYEQLGTPTSNGGQTAVTGQAAHVFSALTDLRWQVGARLALRFLYGYSKQSGVYTENQIGVTASWALLGAQSVTPSAPGLTPTSPASMRSP
jgi:hypothetical protein